MPPDVSRKYPWRQPYWSFRFVSSLVPGQVQLCIAAWVCAVLDGTALVPTGVKNGLPGLARIEVTAAQGETGDVNGQTRGAGGGAAEGDGEAAGLGAPAGAPAGPGCAAGLGVGRGGAAGFGFARGVGYGLPMAGVSGAVY